VWSDEERLAVRLVAFECDVLCYERLAALMGDAGHALRKPIWSDYENLEIPVPGA